MKPFLLVFVHQIHDISFHGVFTKVFTEVFATSFLTQTEVFTPDVLGHGSFHLGRLAVLSWAQKFSTGALPVPCGSWRHLAAPRDPLATPGGDWWILGLQSWWPWRRLRPPWLLLATPGDPWRSKVGAYGTGRELMFEGVETYV